jgi:hypothetical protein
MHARAVLASVALASSALAQTTDTPLSNGGDLIFSTPGTSAPGELNWRAFPGDLLRHAGDVRHRRDLRRR